MKTTKPNKPQNKTAKTEILKTTVGVQHWWVGIICSLSVKFQCFGTFNKNSNLVNHLGKQCIMYHQISPLGAKLFFLCMHGAYWRGGHIQRRGETSQTI